MLNFKNLLTNIFLYNEPKDTYEFSLAENSNENKSNENSNNISNSDAPNQSIYASLSVNLDYIKVK